MRSPGSSGRCHEQRHRPRPRRFLPSRRRETLDCRRRNSAAAASPRRPTAAATASDSPTPPSPAPPKLAAASAGDELVAAEIRVALAELGKVVGTVYTDDLLDRIFSTFCIGK